MMQVNDNHIFIGIGGTGGKVLKAIRKRLFQETTVEERRKLPLGFVYVDSSMEMMNPEDTTWKVLGENSQLGKDSFLYVRSAKLSDQLENVDSYPGISSWIGSKKIWRNIVGNVGDDGAAAQKRRLGRFLFSCSVNEYEAILKNQAQRVKEISGTTDITFHVFAGLAGGTGSGSVVDLVAQTRKHFIPNPTGGLSYKIILYCQIPEQAPLPHWDKGAYHANGYAALTELNAFKVRQFVPSDISGQFDKVPYDGNDLFNSCFLYTNANESGVTVNTKDDLPEIVRDIVYHYITLPGEDGLVREFKDCYSTENVDPKNEYDENAVDTDLKIPVRSKAFKSFGIKRIVNPEEEIKEYLTYSFALQALYRIRYGNWSDELGYRDEAQPEDYRSMVFDNKQFLKSVCLTDEHLMLSLPVLESEKEQHWKTFVDDWESIMPVIGNASWNNNPDNALQEMSRLCQDRFEKKFRNNGVSNFFSIKLQSKDEHAKQITSLIEKNLFEQWKSGERSLYGISRLAAVISEYVDESAKRLQKRIIDNETKLSDLLDRKTRHEQEWGNVGFLGKHLFGSRKDLHAEHIPLMKKIYTLKTELEGLHFAKALIMSLSVDISSLSDSINEMNERFNAAIKEAKNEVNIRCADDKVEDSYQDAIVRYYDPAAVKALTKSLCLSKSCQNDQSKSVLMKIADECGSECSFEKLEEKVSKDVLVSILEKNCRDAATVAHNDYVQGSKKGILDKNIIDQLYEKYGSSEQAEELRRFASDMIRSAGVFLTFDSSETTRSINNNVAPRPGVNIMFRSTLVSIPAVSDKNKEAFADRLAEAFRAGADGSRTVLFERNSARKNEITIMNLTYCFPLRTVNDLKLLKQKYDLMINDPQQGEINRLVLHLEGDGTQYPPLFVEKFKPENYLKEMLIGVAMGLISYQEINDGTGIKYYSQLKVDDMGFALPPVVFCKKLSELHECENIKKSDISALKDDIESKMQNEYLHVTAKAELAKKVVELANMVLGERKNNQSDPVYKKYLDVCKALVTELRN